MGRTTFSGPVASDNGFIGSMTTAPVALPNTDLVLTAAANGNRINITPDVSADRTYDLPAPSAGLYFQFVYGGGAADGHDFIIDTLSNTNYFIGGVTFHDTDDGSVAGVYSDGNSNSKIQVNVPGAAHIHILGIDSTNWQIWGTVVGATAPAFADQ